MCMLGAKPKFGQPFSRHSPEAETVSMHLGITSTSNLLVSCPDENIWFFVVALRMQFYQTNLKINAPFCSICHVTVPSSSQRRPLTPYISC